MRSNSELAETLQDNEVEILKLLSKKTHLPAKEIAEKVGLQENEVLRAAMWLENKGLVSQLKTKSKFVTLGELGERYIKTNLPERCLLDELCKKALKMSEVKLNKDELHFCLGYLKKKGFITLSKGALSLTDLGKKQLGKKTLEELFLVKLFQEKEVEVNKLLPEEKYAFLELRRRKGVIEEKEKTFVSLEVTQKGLAVSKELTKLGKRIGILTPQIIKSGWQKAKFRRYDVEAPAPFLNLGKKQAYLDFLDKAKSQLIAMGFKEMTGPLVEATFFNNDALFMPQDHPARGIHDQYFVSGQANLKDFEKQLKAVAQTHKDGGKTQSLGWRIPFSEDTTKELLMRTQTTAVSARQLMSKDLEIPGKYFTIGRCYRPDVIDATHLTEFNQLEGIVLGENVSFRQVLGMLESFCKKMTGANKVKFLPGYFPFTEPSVEGFIYHPKLNKWIEVAPAGIFRPELTEPLGIKVPVLAWGLGVDRLFMIKEGINDIRHLFSYDLDWLRRAKL